MLLLEKEATKTIHRDNSSKEKACKEAHHFVWEHFLSSFARVGNGTVKSFQRDLYFWNFSRNENPNENLQIWKT